ncbi:MAG: hypothetical protein JSR45_07895 [Proteobacteria bacterium]|nr:hypothetical protein [Pseudomonadota bacterium]
MRRTTFCAAAAAAAISSMAAPSFAADLTRTSGGYTYFNHPGWSVAQHDADITDCRAKIEGMHVPAPEGHTTVTVVGGSVLAAGVGGALGAAIAADGAQVAADNYARPAQLEDCMVVKGWRVVRLGDDEGKALAAASRRQRTPELLAWMVSDQPHGEVVRVFDNDAATATGEQIFPGPVQRGWMFRKDDRGVVIGVLPVPLQGSVSLTPAERRRAELESQKPKPIPPHRIAAARPPKPLGPQELTGIQAGLAWIVVSLTGEADVSLEIDRMGPDAETPGWVDGKPSEVFASRSREAYKAAGASGQVTEVFAVPPGRWRLTGIANGGTELNLCMGSPAFDLRAGEVIYAGAFGAQHTLPDMNLAAAKAAFPAGSPLADAVRPAEWINGTRGKCGWGATIYALEAPGRPFVAGYAIGSRAHVPAKPAP